MFKFRLFSPLLGSQYKDYINTFAAECFSFLMRKVKDKSELVDFMFKSLSQNTDVSCNIINTLSTTLNHYQYQIFDPQDISKVICQFFVKNCFHANFCIKRKNSFISKMVQDRAFIPPPPPPPPQRICNHLPIFTHVSWKWCEIGCFL